jgi:cytochrome P450
VDLASGRASSDPAKAVLVTSPADIRTALLDSCLVPDTTLALSLVGPDSGVTIFHAERGDGHDRRRRAVAAAVKPKVIRAWEPYVADIARALCGSLEGHGSFAAGDSYARPLAARAAAAFVGLPPGRSHELVSLASDVVSLGTRPNRRRLSAVKVLRLTQEALVDADQCPDTTFHDTPGSVLEILRAADTETADILGLVMPILTVGIELGARAVLAVVIAALLKETHDDPVSGLSDTDIDELIARAAILPKINRIAQGQTTICGHALSAGDRVELLVGDAGAPASPDALPFGLGARYCLGAAWVRSIARVGATSFLESFPDAVIRRVDAKTGVQLGGPIEVDIETT